MRAILRVECVLVLVGSSATAEPQEGDAYLDKERGIALDIKASFGEEREKNLSAAADLYKTAATKGNARAQQLLANAYRHGRGVPQDKIWSAVWYLTARIMCVANAFPLESRGFAADLSPGDWAHVVEIAETIFLVRLLAQGLRPDCGEYYDGETWTGRRFTLIETTRTAMNLLRSPGPWMSAGPRTRSGSWMPDRIMPIMTAA